MNARECIIISFKTASVGTLELLEEELGHLWGHGKDPKDLTEDEQYYKCIWDRIRSGIFDKSEKAKNIVLNKVCTVHYDNFI